MAMTKTKDVEKDLKYRMIDSIWEITAMTISTIAIAVVLAVITSHVVWAATAMLKLFMVFMTIVGMVFAIVFTITLGITVYLKITTIPAEDAQKLAKAIIDT